MEAEGAEDDGALGHLCLFGGGGWLRLVRECMCVRGDEGGRRRLRAYVTCPTAVICA